MALRCAPFPAGPRVIDNPAMRRVAGWTVLLAVVLALSLLVLQGSLFGSLLLLVGGAASAWLMWRRRRGPERGAERQPGQRATRESWTAAGGEPVGPDVVPDVAEFARTRAPSDVAEPDQTAREDPRERRPPSTALDRAFNVFFALFVTSVVLWLVAGPGPDRGPHVPFGSRCAAPVGPG